MNSAPYLKFLKVDIWIHTILLVLGILLPLIVYIYSFFLSDSQCSAYYCTSERESAQIGSTTILFFAGIISIIWQLISLIVYLFNRRKISPQLNKKVKILNVITFIFYGIFLTTFFIVSLRYLMPTINLLFLLLFPLFSFLASPIFWIIYYVSLFLKRACLKQPNQTELANK